MSFKDHVWAIVYTVALIGFTTYVALDTFVITRVYDNSTEVSPYADIYTTTTSNDSIITDSTLESESDVIIESQIDSTEESLQETTSNSMTLISDDSTYIDDNIQITLTQYREYDTDIYVADVKISSSEHLKTAFALGTYGKNVTENTSEIAKDNNAILAINGDFYGTQEKGYVIRNGVLYRSTGSSDQEDLVIYVDGSFSIINESDVTAEELLDAGAVQVLSFGPALVMNGEISINQNEEVGKAKASNPRTAICMIDSLHYLFIVSDGRTSQSEGLSLYQLGSFAQSLGARLVYNLDGGGSSTMYFNGTVINNPTTNGKKIKERSVSDIVYIS